MKMQIDKGEIEEIIGTKTDRRICLFEYYCPTSLIIHKKVKAKSQKKKRNILI